jgi:hypothetical protein
MKIQKFVGAVLITLEKPTKLIREESADGRNAQITKAWRSLLQEAKTLQTTTRIAFKKKISI